MYLPSCNIQGLSYTRVDLSLYLFLFSIVHSLPLSPFLSVHSKYVSILLRGKLLFCVIQANPFLQFFLSPQISSLSFSHKYQIFSVSFRLFVNLFVVIKSSLSLLSSSVFSCISYNLFSYVRSLNSDIILVAILCIYSYFNTHAPVNKKARQGKIDVKFLKALEEYLKTFKNGKIIFLLWL